MNYININFFIVIITEKKKSTLKNHELMYTKNVTLKYMNMEFQNN